MGDSKATVCTGEPSSLTATLGEGKHLRRVKEELKAVKVMEGSGRLHEM